MASFCLLLLTLAMVCTDHIFGHCALSCYLKRSNWIGFSTIQQLVSDEIGHTIVIECVLRATFVDLLVLALCQSGDCDELGLVANLTPSDKFFNLFHALNPIHQGHVKVHENEVEETLLGVELGFRDLQGLFS